jgi:hypothetical protein
MLGDTVSVASNFYNEQSQVKRKIARSCAAIAEIMDKLGDENYCPYEDLEAIYEKLELLTD